MEKWLRDAGIIDGSKRYFFLLLKRMHMYTVEEELLLYMISLYNKLKVSLCYQTEDLYKADWRSATNSSRRNKKKKKWKTKGFSWTTEVSSTWNHSKLLLRFTFTVYYY